MLNITVVDISIIGVECFYVTRPSNSTNNFCMSIKLKEHGQHWKIACGRLYFATSFILGPKAPHSAIKTIPTFRSTLSIVVARQQGVKYHNSLALDFENKPSMTSLSDLATQNCCNLLVHWFARPLAQTHLRDAIRWGSFKRWVFLEPIDNPMCLKYV